MYLPSAEPEPSAKCAADPVSGGLLVVRTSNMAFLAQGVLADKRTSDGIIEWL